VSIIARFGTALRDRDWGTAVIDIVVVAIGILMALGVDNWRLDRESREKEDAILMRTHHQVAQIETEIAEVSERVMQNLHM
jgi:hypothetical protein